MSVENESRSDEARGQQSTSVGEFEPEDLDKACAPLALAVGPYAGPS